MSSVIFPSHFRSSDAVRMLHRHLDAPAHVGELMAVRLWFDWAQQRRERVLTRFPNEEERLQPVFWQRENLTYVIEDAVGFKVLMPGAADGAFIVAALRAQLLQAQEFPSPYLTLAGFDAVNPRVSMQALGAFTKNVKDTKRTTLPEADQRMRLMLVTSTLPLEYEPKDEPSLQRAFHLVIRIDRALGLARRENAQYDRELLSLALEANAKVSQEVIDASLVDLTSRRSDVTLVRDPKAVIRGWLV